MSEPYVGQISIVALNFAPRGWAFCDGQLLSISTNTALFSLLGTTYGGDGRTTFGLPDFKGRVPIHVGSGPGLSGRGWGESGGTATTTLDVAMLPGHTHSANMLIADRDGDSTDPSASFVGKSEAAALYADGPAGGDLAGDAVTLAPQGGGNPHNNLQPYQVLNFVIALVGIYPSRS